MPAGGGATYTAQDYRTVKAQMLSEMDADIRAVVDSLVSLTNKNSFYRLLTEYISEGLIELCISTLSLAVSIAPYETGELRSSGQVNFYLGRGGTSRLIADVDADSEGNFTINQLETSIKTAVSRIEAEISFERTDKGLDIALWAHEDLLPWTPRPKRESQKGKWYARQPGLEPKSTGPKYLERAVGEHKNRVQGIMESATKRAIREYNRIHSSRVRRGKR